MANSLFFRLLRGGIQIRFATIVGITFALNLRMKNRMSLKRVSSLFVGIFYSVVSISVLLASSEAGANAQSLDELLTEALKPGDYITSLAPNEWHPEKSRPIFEAASPGNVYAGPGADRAVIGLVLTPQAEAGIFVDIDPRIQLFHRINMVLASSVLTGDVESYRALRLANDITTWAERLKGHGADADADAELLVGDKRFFNWWHKVMQIPDMRAIHDSSGRYFQDVNYLYDKNLFSKFQRLARAGMIHVVRADVTDVVQVRNALAPLLGLGQKISLLDMSNIYAYTNGGGGVMKIVEAFSAALAPESILLLTEGVPTERWLYAGIPIRLVPAFAPKITPFRIYPGDIWDLERRVGYWILNDQQTKRCEAALHARKFQKPGDKQP